LPVIFQIMKKFLILLTAFFCLLTSGFVLAGADLSLNVSDITFSKENPVEGEEVRVFARVFNVGDEDICGFVTFSLNGQEIADPQPISVKVGTYDDVFIDWVFAPGTHNIGAEIVGTYPADENIENNEAGQESYFVDSDVDEDEIGDRVDDDNDNDGLTDEEESVLGTDYLNPDTDGDEVQDSDDIFPLDAAEWADTDEDGLGNNLDTDDDNDGLTDEVELALNINPLDPDTDHDLISDKREVTIGFLKPDRNEWDLARLAFASVGAAVKLEIEKGNMLVGQLFSAFGFLCIVFLILRFSRQRKSGKMNK